MCHRLLTSAYVVIYGTIQGVVDGTVAPVIVMFDLGGLLWEQAYSWSRGKMW